MGGGSADAPFHFSSFRTQEGAVLRQILSEIVSPTHFSPVERVNFHDEIKTIRSAWCRRRCTCRSWRSKLRGIGKR